MARDRSSIVKQSRREKYALHPKAHKYLIKRTGIPGQHGAKGRRPRNNSQYSIQLREKQKVKRLYGLLEKQFSNLVRKATKRGRSGENILINLERRLDNAVYRAGFAYSRRSARQLVSHRHFALNGRRVNIPSITLKVDDRVSVYPKSQKNNYFKVLDDLSPAPNELPDWLDIKRSKFNFKVKKLPSRDHVLEEINEQLIIEYYSK